MLRRKLSSTSRLDIEVEESMDVVGINQTADGLSRRGREDKKKKTTKQRPRRHLSIDCVDILFWPPLVEEPLECLKRSGPLGVWPPKWIDR